MSDLEKTMGLLDNPLPLLGGEKEEEEEEEEKKEEEKKEEEKKEESDSIEEDRVFSGLMEGRNQFLSGPGGTGKSTMLKRLFLRLVSEGKVVCKTGSTGVAAESIGGMTLHSWAGVMLGDKDAMTYYITIRGRNKKAMKRWMTTEILFIDEISMVGGKFLKMLNELAQLIQGNKLPFGGITLLFCGDVCQLPPVKDNYFFTIAEYETFNFQYTRLTKPWRFQKDIQFFYLLSRLRLGEQTNEDIALLKTRQDVYYKDIRNKNFKEGEVKPTRLFSKKIDVAEMNRKELDLIDHEEFCYVAADDLQKKTKSSEGTLKHFQDLMDKNVPPAVSLKKGAQVMLTWNLDVENGLCNGSRGVVVECFDESVMVKFKNGQEIMIIPNVWTMEDEDNIFTRAQIPLILAWSFTIHKSQSATLDSVILDLGTTIFSDNMAYVALSRCRDLESIYIINLIRDKIKCDPDAKAFELEMVAEYERDTQE